MRKLKNTKKYQLGAQVPSFPANNQQIQQNQFMWGNPTINTDLNNTNSNINNNGFTLKTGFQFGQPNYSYIALSNTLQAIAAGFRGLHQNKEQNQYYQNQFNPLNIIEKTGNTSEQNQFGQSYMQGGGEVDKIFGLPKIQSGGSTKISYNPNLASNDVQFQQWYNQNTLEGRNQIPYSNKGDYDYYSYFRNGDYKNYQGSHFPDTYKRPNHKTFSDESIYSIPENKGGHWDGNTFVRPMQFGGNINVTGYLDGAPTASNPYNIIPGDDITMKGVNKKIQATPIYNGIPGQPTIMHPGLDYSFKGADYVHEQPFNTTWEGGVPTFNLSKQIGKKVNLNLSTIPSQEGTQFGIGLVKSFQAGGSTKQPIVVTNPNDPRLKAYNDSLNAYQKYGDLATNFVNGKYAKEKDVMKLRNMVDEGSHHYLAINKAFYLNEVYGHPTVNVPFFKEPVQPVVYQKPQEVTDPSGGKWIVPNYKQKQQNNSYQDSLKLYNNNIDLKKYPSWYDVGDRSLAEKLMFEKNIGWDGVPINSKIKPIKRVYWGEGLTADIYKKPVGTPVERKDYPLANPENYKAHGNIQITSLQQSQAPVQPQTTPQGQIMYGPANSAIGYMTNAGKFTPIEQNKMSQLNKADRDLLNNPQALQKYTTTTPRYQDGGPVDFEKDFEDELFTETPKEAPQEVKQEEPQLEEQPFSQDELSQPWLNYLLNNEDVNQSNTGGIEMINGVNQSGKFQSFATPEQGRQALLNQLNLYQTGKSKSGIKPTDSLFEFTSKYAPESDKGNDPLTYAHFLSKKLGVSINTPISRLDKNKLADAISQIENNKSGNNPGNLRSIK